MYFIEPTNINEFNDLIISMPAMSNKNPELLNKLKNILYHYFEEVYLKNPENIKRFMNYEIDDTYLETFFENYSIDKKYLSKINTLFKKTLAYYLESLYQLKGSILVLEIFSKIFENIFQGINFYQIIVTRQEEIITQDDGTKLRQFSYKYELEPLIINNKDKILTEFNNKVSLTGKHLMTLEQYSDFKIFPIRTNLIYVQFTSIQANIDNDKTFNQIIQAYALTKLSNIFFELKNFYNLSFVNLNGVDLFHLLKFADLTRVRLNFPSFTFHYNDKLMYNLIFSQDSLENIEEILYEYKKLDYKDRKATDNLYRKWKFLVKQYSTVKRLYHNYDEMQNYLIKNNSDLVNLILSFKTEEEFIDFYINLYNQIINKIDQNDFYLILFINFIFLNLITNDAFIDNFFMPIYNLFQHYFFPIDMDFLNTLSEEFVIKDKFESFGTSDDQKISIDLKGFMSKYLERPDEIFVYFTTKINDNNKINDKVSVFPIVPYKFIVDLNDNQSLLIYNTQKENYYLNDKNTVIVNNNFTDKNVFSDLNNVIVQVNSNDKQSFQDNESILINVSLTNEKQIDDNQSIYLDLKFSDQTKYNDDNNETINRANYLELNTLNNYLIFYNEQVRKESSFLDNFNYKYNNLNDYLYFNINNLF